MAGSKRQSINQLRPPGPELPPVSCRGTALHGWGVRRGEAEGEAGPARGRLPAVLGERLPKLGTGSGSGAAGLLSPVLSSCPPFPRGPVRSKMRRFLRPGHDPARERLKRDLFQFNKVRRVEGQPGVYGRHEAVTLPGNPMAVQWLGHHTLTAEGAGSIPGWRTKIPQAALRGRTNKQKVSPSPQAGGLALGSLLPGLRYLLGTACYASWELDFGNGVWLEAFLGKGDRMPRSQFSLSHVSRWLCDLCRSPRLFQPRFPHL